MVPSAFIGPKWLQPSDGFEEKSLLAYPPTPNCKKNMIFCNCDQVMHRTHKNERRCRTNKFFFIAYLGPSKTQCGMEWAPKMNEGEKMSSFVIAKYGSFHYICVSVQELYTVLISIC